MSLYSRLPKKPTWRQNLGKMNIRERILKILFWLLIIALLVSCCAATIALASGAWQGLVATVTSLINQGPAAIVSAIIAVLFSWYCLVPLIPIVLFILIVVFVPSWISRY